MSRLGTRVGGFELIAVAALLALGAGLRWWRLDLGWFGVDQARDIQTALDVVAGHDWPSVGPTMRRVTSLGALYYYFWALPHVLSDDPLAAYRFAAGLGVVTLVLTWAFARRYWGERAGLVTLAVLATSPVAVIDGRVAWAPAALPAMAMVLLWLLVAAPTVPRMAALGAGLGLAIQLHLTMAAWGLAAVVLAVVRRPTWRALVAMLAGGLVTGFPAVYAALANAGHDAGITTLQSRGPFPDVAGRLVAWMALGWRVPEAFWSWPDAGGGSPALARPAAMLLATFVLVGLVRLVTEAFRARGPALVVVTALACQLGMVVLLPGEVWYYYLDATLPLCALAAGAAVAGASTLAPVSDERSWLSAAAALAIVACLGLGGWSAAWIGASARHGYVMLNPAALTLDGGGGRDASVTGRLLSVGVKRALATTLAVAPASFATRWQTTHGPAFDDATGDNGFWLGRTAASDASGAVPHAVLWYRDDPTAPTTPAPGVELATVGPLVLARYRPAIDYDSCRDVGGPVAVPVRVLPHPRRYGDGTLARSPTMPAQITCTLAAGTGATRVVAAVTAGTVALQDGAGGQGPVGRESSLCLTRGPVPTPFTIAIALPAGTLADLDLYERPDPTCAAGKIAP